MIVIVIIYKELIWIYMYVVAIWFFSSSNRTSCWQFFVQQVIKFQKILIIKYNTKEAEQYLRFGNRLPQSLVQTWKVCDWLARLEIFGQPVVLYCCPLTNPFLFFFIILGKLCIEVMPTSKIAFISETLCIGCGICVKVKHSIKWCVILVLSTCCPHSWALS